MWTVAFRIGNSRHSLLIGMVTIWVISSSVVMGGLADCYRIEFYASNLPRHNPELANELRASTFFESADQLQKEGQYFLFLSRLDENERWDHHLTLFRNGMTPSLAFKRLFDSPSAEAILKPIFATLDMSEDMQGLLRSRVEPMSLADFVLVAGMMNGDVGATYRMADHESVRLKDDEISKWVFTKAAALAEDENSRYRGAVATVLATLELRRLDVAAADKWLQIASSTPYLSPLAIMRGRKFADQITPDMTLSALPNDLVSLREIGDASIPVVFSMVGVEFWYDPTLLSLYGQLFFPEDINALAEITSPGQRRQLAEIGVKICRRVLESDEVHGIGAYLLVVGKLRSLDKKGLQLNTETKRWLREFSSSASTDELVEILAKPSRAFGGLEPGQTLHDPIRLGDWLSDYLASKDAALKLGNR